LLEASLGAPVAEEDSNEENGVDPDDEVSACAGWPAPTWTIVSCPGIILLKMVSKSFTDMFEILHRLSAIRSRY